VISEMVVNVLCTCSFICQSTFTWGQQNDLFGFRVKLSPVTIYLAFKG